MGMLVCGLVATCSVRTASTLGARRLARKLPRQRRLMQATEPSAQREGLGCVKVAIQGFGRVGRNILRGWMAQTETTFEIVAISLNKMDIRTATHLLKFDSTLGRYQGDVFCTETAIVVDGRVLQVVYSPDALGKMGVDVIIDATGKNASLEKASKLIEQTGASNVVLTTPGKDCPVYVHGVNSSNFDVQRDKVVSLYGISISPAVKVIDDNFDVQYGMTSVLNSWTSDQKLLDANHKDLRRARAAACNIIPSTSGNNTAVAATIPKLAGKISCGGFRVPTKTVSVQDIVLRVGKPCTREEVNDAFRAAAAGPMRGILRVEEQPLVSSDFRQSNYLQTMDAALTMVMGGDLVKVIAWYDNEWSSAQHHLSFVSIIAAKLEESRRRAS